MIPYFHQLGLKSYPTKQFSVFCHERSLTIYQGFGVAYLRDDFASFVGWASCPSLVFQGARVAHPTRIIP
ncbi:MAG: hypothetical protein V7L01_33615 [Nostoc sp.]|uniref:hypothetical protein n=1 Tax=Nostoc sp. TaxID=1180 RepID=UPI002FFBFB27